MKWILNNSRIELKWNELKKWKRRVGKDKEKWVFLRKNIPKKYQILNLKLKLKKNKKKIFKPWNGL